MKENLYDDLYTEQEEQVDYKALFFKYLIHWKWFVASIVVCLIGGWIYLHYTTPVYSITGSVIIKDNKKTAAPAPDWAIWKTSVFTRPPATSTMKWKYCTHVPC